MLLRTDSFKCFWSKSHWGLVLWPALFISFQSLFLLWQLYIGMSLHGKKKQNKKTRYICLCFRKIFCLRKIFLEISLLFSIHWLFLSINLTIIFLFLDSLHSFLKIIYGNVWKLALYALINIFVLRRNKKSSCHVPTARTAKGTKDFKESADWSTWQHYPLSTQHPTGFWSWDSQKSVSPLGPLQNGRASQTFLFPPLQPFIR